MKNAFLLLLAFCCYGSSHAQRYRFETLVTGRTICLNGSSATEGKSMDYVQVLIPKGATALIYTMTVNAPDLPPARHFSLLAGLTALAGPGNKSLDTIVSRLSVPEGTATADIYYITGYEHFLAFLEKKAFAYQSGYSRTSRSATKALIPLKGKQDTLYLGLRNPAALQKVTLTLDVVAVSAQ